MAKGKRLPVELDWFNISYNSLVRAGLVVVLLAAAGGVYWYQVGIKAPREDVRDAIASAEQKYGEASARAAELPNIAEIVESSGTALKQAREAFSGLRYEDARISAFNSERLSLQALRLAGDQEAQGQMARFARVEGNVRVKRAGEFNWEPADTRMTLQEGDSVKTSSSGSAQLIYFDGAVSTLVPGTLLTIRQLEENPVTNVRRVSEKVDFGEVRASTQDKNVQGSYHEVATEKITARTEDAGEFRVVVDPEKKDSRVDVFGGAVQVASASTKEELVAGEGIRVDRDGRLSAKMSLPGLPKLLAPPDQRVFIAEKPESIMLSWKPVPGAVEYRLVISDKALFTEPLYDALRRGTSAELEDVPSGAYHWKVAALSDSGAVGEYSAARRFRVSSQRIKDHGDTVPPVLEITEFVQVGQMVIVNGRTEPGATLWADSEKIEIDDSGDFYAVIRLQREGNNDIAFVAQDTAGNEETLVKSAYLEVY
jgi:hypothetical protein